MLKFSAANTKTKKLAEIDWIADRHLYKGRKVYSLDLPSGWTCPGASDCLSRAIIVDGKARIKDGPHTKFRCFSASQEVVYPNVYRARQHNLACLKAAKTTSRIEKLILESMPKNCGILRYHVSGDFYNLAYFKAAYNVANRRKNVLFYAYTKSLKYLLNIPMYHAGLGMMLPNFMLTASKGGKYDDLIDTIGIRSATVVFSEKEASDLGLEIDHDDSHAATYGKSFALLLHGSQPQGSEAAQALKEIKNGNG